jgi:ATP-dependent Clp protease ATP-binding subunit ClpA
MERPATGMRGAPSARRATLLARLHVWAVYLQASEEARRRGDRRTGTDHILLALFEDPSIEVVLGVSLQQARQTVESLDHEALGALGLGPDTDAPPLPMRAVPKRPTLRHVMQKDRFRMTPAAKRVLQEAVKPNRRKTRVTAQQVLAQILVLQPPDPAAVLLSALGVNTSEVRRRLDLPGEAGNETSSDAAASFNGRSLG